MTHPPVTPRDYLPETVDLDLAWRWIEALESKRYQQGQGRLRHADDSFCSLGVLCDVADPTAWQEGDEYVAFSWHDEASYLPSTLQGRLILTASGKRADGGISLTGLNDLGTDFDTIATLLRDYYGFPPREDQP